MNHRIIYGFLAVSAMNSAMAENINPIAKGQAMAWQCAPCHGTNGQEFEESMPPIAAMPAEQFTKAMLDFRQGDRPATIMDRVAKGFTDEEIRAMASWFELQPKKQWVDTSLEEAQLSLDATRGQK